MDCHFDAISLFFSKSVPLLIEWCHGAWPLLEEDLDFAQMNLSLKLMAKIPLQKNHHHGL